MLNKANLFPVFPSREWSHGRSVKGDYQIVISLTLTSVPVLQSGLRTCLPSKWSQFELEIQAAPSGLGHELTL